MSWQASRTPETTGRLYRLVVTGDVQVTATNYTPKLAEHRPQGINPRILLLDLTIVRTGGFGGQIVFYKHVMFTKRTSGNAYDEVDILYRGKVIQRIKVGHPKSLRKAGAKKKTKTAKKKKRR